ncbi:hypothetical protein BEP19_08080 [Ammoniphilus oxalaticus]|uniref:SLH domain-containing protein n=1 Tax=Ammoniphilus oxalaticus TaxID=66863 RepID=A0A419SJY5_9BACL|nr:S-layer homology domain-containing protein [Ammoniphilus oxalaticus]RKD24344.1 hypothetical protein BEP19_08080 [Ammoniphilus oxalaticus]
MNFRKGFLALSLSTVMVTGLFAGGVNASAQDTGITRGEFAKAVVKQLDLSATNQNITLLSDVTTDSPYAESVGILQQRKVIVGYPDGTFQPNKPISKQEAYIILSKTLGISINQAEQIFNKEYGIQFKNKTLTDDEAKKAIQQALQSDPGAYQWMIDSAEVQLQQKSFRSDLKQQMKMIFSENIPEMNNQNELSMNADVKMEYHVEDGIHLTTVVDLGQLDGIELPEELADMKIEQYITPEGMFMQMPDPETGEVAWIKMDGTMMPFTFEQLMEMQKDSVGVNQALLDNKNVFYRDLGTEALGDAQTRKIGYRSRFTSFQELMGMIGQSLPDGFEEQLGAQLESVPEMGDLSLSGVMWIDETSKLPTKLSQEITFEMGQLANEDLPIDKMQIKQEGTMYDYNQVEKVVLPEEAKNAKTFEEMLEEANVELGDTPSDHELKTDEETLEDES